MLDYVLCMHTGPILLRFFGAPWCRRRRRSAGPRQPDEKPWKNKMNKCRALASQTRRVLRFFFTPNSNNKIWRIESWDYEIGPTIAGRSRRRGKTQQKTFFGCLCITRIAIQTKFISMFSVYSHDANTRRRIGCMGNAVIVFMFSDSMFCKLPFICERAKINASPTARGDRARSEAAGLLRRFACTIYLLFAIAMVFSVFVICYTLCCLLDSSLFGNLSFVAVSINCRRCRCYPEIRSIAYTVAA